MTRKLMIAGLLCLFSFSLWAEDQAGYNLLKDLTLSFKKLAEEGSGGYEGVNSVLQNIMDKLKNARSEEKVDRIFYNRYHRLLEVIKLTIIDTPYDSEGILDSLIEREINKFVRDVTGENGSLQGKMGIGAVAGAIAEEILNLHLYLDTRDEREKLMKKYQEELWGKKKEGAGQIQ